MKSGVQPCIRCGRNIGCDAAGLPSSRRACTTPLPRIGALSGSQAITSTSGRSAFSTRATPLSVPPVPVPVTKASRRRPAKAARISRAVVRAWMSALASFSNWRARNQPCFSASSRGLRGHAGALLGGRGQHHPRAEEAHQPPALDAEALGHDDDERVALHRADHGEADAGVAARRLDDGLAGPERRRRARPPR